MLRATFMLNDGRLRINCPVVRKNEHTLWAVISGKRKGQGRYSKPSRVAIKRHIKKDGVTLSKG